MVEQTETVHERNARVESGGPGDSRQQQWYLIEFTVELDQRGRSLTHELKAAKRALADHGQRWFEFDPDDRVARPDDRVTFDSATVVDFVREDIYRPDEKIKLREKRPVASSAEKRQSSPDLSSPEGRVVFEVDRLFWVPWWQDWCGPKRALRGGDAHDEHPVQPQPIYRGAKLEPGVYAASPP